MKQIRQISTYDRSIKDKYYVTDNGTFYVEILNRRVMKGLERRVVTKNFIKETIASDKIWCTPFKDWGVYCIVLRNGKVLRRLKTYIRKHCNTVVIALITTNDKEVRLYVSRVVANTFITDVTDKEVHHIDRDRTNNNVSNLEVLTFQEHRGKNSIKHK